MHVRFCVSFFPSRIITIGIKGRLRHITHQIYGRCSREPPPSVLVLRRSLDLSDALIRGCFFSLLSAHLLGQHGNRRWLFDTTQALPSSCAVILSPTQQEVFTRRTTTLRHSSPRKALESMGFKFSVDNSVLKVS